MIKLWLRRVIYLICLISLISGCGARRQYNLEVDGSTENLGSLQSLHVKKILKTGDSKTLTEMRLQALRETAISLSAQSALAYRSKQMNALLESHASNLNRVFDFRAMLLNKHVLPPVLEEGRDTASITDNKTLRLADRTYRMITQARFVTAPPTWRDYLGFNYERPEAPHGSLLPKNDLERKRWAAYVQEGWNQGLAQADSIYQENLARLTRDYIGMALYRKLLANNMVSRPYVGSTSLGVTGDNEQLRVNDQVLRITQLPKMTVESNQWNPVVQHEQ